MRKRLLAMIAGAVSLTGIAATDAMARVDAVNDGVFTVVPGSTITISIASLLSNDRVVSRPSVRFFFQGLFRTPKSSGIAALRVNRDRTITIRFRANFTGNTQFGYVIRGSSANGRPNRDFDRANVFFRVASPS